MTSDIKFYAIHNFDDPQCRPYKHPVFNSPPTSWTIIEPKFSPTRTAQVLFATDVNSLNFNLSIFYLFYFFIIFSQGLSLLWILKTNQWIHT